MAANVGVIAGLILVAVQINQNTAITKAQIANEVGQRWWNQVKGDYPDEFREYVDRILAEDSLSNNREMMDALMPAEIQPE